MGLTGGRWGLHARVQVGVSVGARSPYTGVDWGRENYFDPIQLFIIFRIASDYDR